ncbi:hypothetical protein LSH36_583g01192 [Paralvinella palmiformis]|uniref:ACT domain-containing protein n=1 Tax=Paralvinella palmiformis TaxID=53620 RepID=A0AAD9J614_9ANNE|nr:hypothetical protein LSH36_583g01192 [Paralvinella palmiformis]
MKLILTVIGKDNTGIIAGVSSVCATQSANILDIQQTIMDTTFVMIMLVEALRDSLSVLRDELLTLEKKLGVKINVYNEEVFHAMHRV